MSDASLNTLYHYCSSETFASIISNKSIRLSSLTLSNDTQEGKLLIDTLKKMFRKDEFSFEEHNTIEEALNQTQLLLEGLGFCLSEKPDLLSQWRGYADDGHGFSIGFSKSYFENLSVLNKKSPRNTKFLIGKVVYETEAQEEMLSELYQTIKQQIKSGKLNSPKYGLLPTKTVEDINLEYKTYIDARRDLITTLIDKSYDIIYRLKSIAFSEEAEWRLISLFSAKLDANLLYRATKNRLIPYKSLSLEKIETKTINEIYIDPKNITPPEVIEGFLSKYGFNDVRIQSSATSYR